MSQPKKENQENSYDSIFQTKYEILKSFKKENLEAKKQDEKVDDSVSDDIEIVTYVNKNKNDFQELLSEAKTEEQIKKVIYKYNPLNDTSVFDPIFKRWAELPSKTYYSTWGSQFTYFIMSFILGSPKSHGQPDFIYFLPKDRINAFPNHFDGAGTVTISKYIQTTNKVSELMAFGTGVKDSNSKIATFFKGFIPQGSSRLGVFLISVGIALAFSIGGINAVTSKWKDHSEHVKMIENLQAQHDTLVQNNKTLQQQYKDGKITEDDFKNQATSNNQLIKNLQQQIDQ